MLRSCVLVMTIFAAMDTETGLEGRVTCSILAIEQKQQ